MKKKVFLWNTHLVNIINSPFQLIPHLKNVIRILTERDDTVLLWRPHPLSIPTIQAMNPKLCEEYLQLVEEFQLKGNCIYDVSENFNIGFALSDALISDPSSLVELYGFTGKPIYSILPIHNIISKYNIFQASVQYKGWIYFSSCLWNGFYKMDKITGEIVSLGNFKADRNVQGVLHHTAHRHQNYCWFLPQHADYITKVNLDTLEMTAIPYREECNLFGNDSTEFVTCKQRGEYLWLIPYLSDKIISVHICTNAVSCYSIVEKISDYIPDEYYQDAIMLEDNLVLFPSRSTDVIVMNIKTKDIENIHWEYPPKSFADVVRVGDNLWFFPEKFPYIVRININTKQQEKIEVPNKFKIKAQSIFKDACYFNGSIWAIPYSFEANAVLKINPLTLEQKILTIDGKRIKKIIESSDVGWDFHMIDYSSEDSNEIFIKPLTLNSLIKIDTDNDEIQYLSLFFSDEKRFENLEYFVEQVCEEHGKERQPDTEGDTYCNEAGKRIWQHIKNEITGEAM